VRAGCLFEKVGENKSSKLQKFLLIANFWFERYPKNREFAVTRCVFENLKCEA